MLTPAAADYFVAMLPLRWCAMLYFAIAAAAIRHAVFADISLFRRFAHAMPYAATVASFRDAAMIF